jgi:transcriptional regulator with XRE-family HTH domain
MNDVGTRLRSAREKSGLSQLEVSLRAGLHVRTIHNIETGKKTRCRLTTYFRLADAVGVNPYWLMSGEDEIESGGQERHVSASRSM